MEKQSHAVIIHESQVFSPYEVYSKSKSFLGKDSITLFPVRMAGDKKGHSYDSGGILLKGKGSTWSTPEGLTVTVEFFPDFESALERYQTADSEGKKAAKAAKSKAARQDKQVTITDLAALRLLREQMEAEGEEEQC